MRAALGGAAVMFLIGATTGDEAFFSAETSGQTAAIGRAGASWPSLYQPEVPRAAARSAGGCVALVGARSGDRCFLAYARGISPFVGPRVRGERHPVHCAKRRLVGLSGQPDEWRDSLPRAGVRLLVAV